MHGYEMGVGDHELMLELSGLLEMFIWIKLCSQVFADRILRFSGHEVRGGIPQFPNEICV